MLQGAVLHWGGGGGVGWGHEGVKASEGKKSLWFGCKIISQVCGPGSSNALAASPGEFPCRG